MPSRYLYPRTRGEIHNHEIRVRSMFGSRVSRRPLDMENKNKSNSKQVNDLPEAPIKDKVELAHCKMGLLPIYSVLDFILGWPKTWIEQNQKAVKTVVLRDVC